MAAWIGPAIQAVAGVVGSLFGGKSESKVNYRAMVREAELAGFNPLTVLRNGGAAGFTTQSSGTIGSRLAEGLAGVGNALTNYDPFEDKRRDIESRVAEAQIANLNANTENVKRMSIGSVPTYTGPVSPRPFGSSVKQGQGVTPLASIVEVEKSGELARQEPETKQPTRVNPYPSYLNWEVNPWTASGEDWENWHGDSEINSMAGALNTYGHDAAWNLYRLGRWGARQLQTPSTYNPNLPASRTFYQPPMMGARKAYDPRKPKYWGAYQ